MRLLLLAIGPSLLERECEGFQIFIPPSASMVRANASQLSGPGKAIEVRLYREEWIDVRTPSNIEGKPC